MPPTLSCRCLLTKKRHRSRSEALSCDYAVPKDKNNDNAKQADKSIDCANLGDTPSHGEKITAYDGFMDVLVNEINGASHLLART